MDLFQMSLTASPLILIIVAARLLLLYQLPKWTFKALWLVALLRLIVPYTLPSQLSIFNIFPVQKKETLLITYSADGSIPSLSASSVSDFPISPWHILWLIGCIAVAVFFLRTHIKNRMKFIDSDKVEHPNLTQWFQANTIRRPMRIRFSDQISGPLTYGVFMPVILLPKDTNLENDQQLRFILTHEYIHLCRFDALIKAILAAALCIHWFNPLVWIMFMLATRDIELACDEGVLRTLGYSKRDAYAFLLINMSASQSSSASVINHFSENVLEERIVAIMKMKKKKMAAIILGLIVTTGIVSVFATDEKIVVDGFIEEPYSFDRESNYLNMIRRFCYDQTKYPSDSYQEIQAVAQNEAAVKDYEEAIPDLISSGRVSKKMAYENLENLNNLLAGSPVDFSHHQPHIYLQRYSSDEYWFYGIILHNGESDDPYYYTVPILVID